MAKAETKRKVKSTGREMREKGGGVAVKGQIKENHFEGNECGNLYMRKFRITLHT